MERIILSIISALMFVTTNAQQNEVKKFSCIDLMQVLSKWDSIHKSCENIKQKEYNHVWAQKVKAFPVIQDNLVYLFSATLISQH